VCADCGLRCVCRAVIVALCSKPNAQVDCTCCTYDVPVSACAGVRDDGCSRPYFCLTFNTSRNIIQASSGNVTCRYKYRAPGSVCPLLNGTAGLCTDQSASCARTCQQPQLLMPGTEFLVTKSQNCSANVAMGRTCRATCAAGWNGFGYNTTCQSNGSWSSPAGGGCQRTVCGACRVPSVCDNAVGCQCISGAGDSGCCQCPSALGLKEETFLRNGVLTSRCLWDVQFPWMMQPNTGSNSSSTPRNLTYFLVMAVNRTVVLPFTVAAGNGSRMCPASRVISSEEWVGEERPSCPRGPNARQIQLATSVFPPREFCNTSLGRLFYYFRTSKMASARPGACFVLRVTTTDGMMYLVNVMFS
jgi:hypothetical protein